MIVGCFCEQVRNLLTFSLLLLQLRYCKPQQNVFYEEDEICDSVKCSCDCATKTLACRRLIFEYLPIFPQWVETLQLSGNHLTMLRDYSFVNLTKLRHLDFADNDLEYIYPNAFAGLSNLESLDLSANRLTHLTRDTFRDLRKLTRVSFAANDFTDLSAFGEQLFGATDNRTFIDVDLSRNQFAQSDRSVRLLKTRKLSLSGSKFFAFTGSGLILAAKDDEQVTNRKVVLLDVFDQVQHLDVSDCGAELYPEFIDRLRNIIRLNIGGNNVHIEDLTKLKSFHRLEFLNVSGIRTTSQLDVWDVFPPAIKELDVSNLRLKSINFTDFPYVGELETLTASHNAFVEFQLSQRLLSLKRLILSDNSLTDFPKSGANLKFTRLELLDLSRNRLSSLVAGSLTAYPSLVSLSVAYNQLLTIDARAFASTPKLQSLDLSNNLLPRLISLDLVDLRVLNASNNRLIDADVDAFERLPTLEVVDLSYNADLLSSINSCSQLFSKSTACENPDWFDNIVAAKQLSSMMLARIGMHRFPRRFFAALVNLNKLNVAENSINESTWDEAVADVRRMPCIKHLNLSSNRVSYFRNLSLFQNPCMQIVDVSRNPFECDCNLQPLIELLKSSAYSERVLYNESLYYCFSSKNNWRYPLYEFVNVLQPCDVRTPFNAFSLLLYIFLGLISTVFIAVFCRLCIVAVRKGVLHSQYIYRPLQLFTEDPTNLVQL